MWLGRVAAAHLVARSSLERAAAWLPFHPDSYDYDLSVRAGFAAEAAGDPGAALRHYRKSLQSDPRSNPVWLMVALAEERSGRDGEALRAYGRAESAEPSRPETYWLRGNFHLRRQRKPEAIADFERVLGRTRRLDDPVFQTLIALDGVDAALRAAQTVKGARLPLLRYVWNREPPRVVSDVWKRFPPPVESIAREEIEQHCRRLASLERDRDAWDEWRRWAEARGVAAGPLIRNGGFEAETVAAPFDWSLLDGPGWHVFRDPAQAYAGAASLQVLFLGSHNLDNALAEQWLALEPGHRYRLSFVWRARNVISDAPPAIEVMDLGGRRLGAIALEAGSPAWRKEQVEFTARERSIARLMVVRGASRKLDGRIAGSVWLDAFQLDALQ
ncbi:MAG: tetratricopeptide repeat protein [Bryobacteraceae bacterium]